MEVNSEARISDETILDCGHKPSAHSEHTTGYGKNPDTGKTLCWECCAVEDTEFMLKTGKNLMYLTHKGDHLPCVQDIHNQNQCKLPGHWKVTNWPGSLSIPVSYIKHSKTNGFGRMMGRTDVQFRFHGRLWYGRHQGENNTTIRVKRLGKP